MQTNRVFSTILIVLLFGVARGQEASQLQGQVTDAAGKPVEGAEVATFWGADGGSMKAFGGVTTDPLGKFSLKAQLYGRPGALLAISKDQGAVVEVDPKEIDKPILLKLQPLISVHGRFVCKELSQKTSWTNVYVMLPGKTTPRVLQCSSGEGAFSFRLPPGTYKFWGYGSDIQNHRQDLMLSADKVDVDLGNIEVQVTIIARHRGKAPPDWNVTDARGLKKNVKLEDLRGKWVLIEFWGYW